MRQLRWLFVALIAAIVGGQPTPRSDGQAAFRHLVLEPKVSDNLALFFHKFDTELVLCLEGERRGPDLFVTDFRVPHVLVSEAGRVQAAACRFSERNIGTWHNHPAPRLSLTAAEDAALARNCYLSRTDISDFQRREAARVSVVACGPRIYAYWKREDVDTTGTDVALLPPPPGQLVQVEGQLDAGAGALTQARRR